MNKSGIKNFLGQWNTREAVNFNKCYIKGRDIFTEQDFLTFSSMDNWIKGFFAVGATYRPPFENHHYNEMDQRVLNLLSPIIYQNKGILSMTLNIFQF